MKNILRWLCKKTGVEAEIRFDERDKIGCEIQSLHHWFSSRKSICNALWFLSLQIKKGGFFDFNKYRDKVLDLGEKRYDEQNI